VNGSDLSQAAGQLSAQLGAEIGAKLDSAKEEIIAGIESTGKENRKRIESTMAQSVRKAVEDSARKPHSCGGGFRSFGAQDESGELLPFTEMTPHLVSCTPGGQHDGELDEPVLCRGSAMKADRPMGKTADTGDSSPTKNAALASRHLFHLPPTDAPPSAMGDITNFTRLPTASWGIWSDTMQLIIIISLGCYRWTV
jgi:hypothetical protein